MKVRILTGTALLALALALPATANAATTITAGPLKVRGYQMTLIGNDSGSKDSLTVLFARSAGKGAQQHMYTFTKHVKVTRTSITAKLGRFGSIKLRLSGARSTSTKQKLPKGCTGTLGKTKVGTLRGTFKFVADKRFFRTVKVRKLRAIVSSTGKLNCAGTGTSGQGGDGAGGGSGAADPRLNQSTYDNGAMFNFTATRRVLSAIQTENPKTTAPATIMHMITASGSGLSVTGTGATVRSVGPFFGGTGTFAASGPVAGTVVPGVLSGNLVAKFDSIAPVSVTGNATLMNP